MMLLVVLLNTSTSECNKCNTFLPPLQLHRREREHRNCCRQLTRMNIATIEVEQSKSVCVCVCACVLWEVVKGVERNWWKVKVRSLFTGSPVCYQVKHITGKVSTLKTLQRGRLACRTDDLRYKTK